MSYKTRSAILVISLVLFSNLALIPKSAVAQGGDRECQALKKQIEDSVERVANVSERIARTEARLETANREVQVQHEEATHQKWINTRNTLQHTLATDKSTIQRTKGTLLDRLCGGKQCEALKKQIEDSVERVANVSERIARTEARLETANREVQVQHEEATHQKWINTRNTLQHTLETDKSTIQRTKGNIDTLLDRLCTCCSKKSETTGAIDRCLVGTWRSESYVGASFVRYRGGSGILLSVKADGQTTIDYSGMQPVEQIHPVTQETISKEWRSGEATGHIMTNNGLVTVSSVEKSKLDGKEINQYGTKSLSASGLGTVFLGGGKVPSPYNLNYACSETALAIKQVVGSQALRTFNFKREKKEP